MYWLVALPLADRRRKEVAWEMLQEQTASTGLSQNSKLEVPDLRVGTLDTLMALRWVGWSVQSKTGVSARHICLHSTHFVQATSCYVCQPPEADDSSVPSETLSHVLA